MTVNPTPGTAAEIVRELGIEAIRGLPLKDGNRTLFVSNRLIDRMVAEAEEDHEIKAMQWRERVYGGDTPDADMVVHIRLNTVYPA